MTFTPTLNSNFSALSGPARKDGPYIQLFIYICLRFCIYWFASHITNDTEKQQSKETHSNGTKIHLFPYISREYCISKKNYDQRDNLLITYSLYLHILFWNTRNGWFMTKFKIIMKTIHNSYKTLTRQFKRQKKYKCPYKNMYKKWIPHTHYTN